MKIGLISLDKKSYPNLALMKLSAYHKANGAHVEFYRPLVHYDLVYISKVFTESEEDPYYIDADEIVRGGSGYDLENRLPSEIEHSCPDYLLYPEVKYALGFLTRGCVRNCQFCIVPQKEGIAHKVADLDEWYRGQKEIKLLDPNILAVPERNDLLLQLVKSNAKIDFTQGLDARLIDSNAIDLISKMKIKRLHFAWDQMNASDSITRNLVKIRKKLGYGRGKLSLYILVNYSTTLEEDFVRIEWAIQSGYHPYVMVFDKHKIPTNSIYSLMQSWTQCYCYSGTIWEWAKIRKSKIPPEIIGTIWEEQYYAVNNKTS